jgi:flavin-dependent dehydrogenase
LIANLYITSIQKPMNNPERQDNLRIIGAGFAGLAAGIYTRMNGYKADIFEMQDTRWEAPCPCRRPWQTASKSLAAPFTIKVRQIKSLRRMARLLVSCSHFELEKPVIIGGAERTWISYHTFNHDPSMAPAGKSAIVVMLKADYHFWKQLSEDKTAYVQAREEAHDTNPVRPEEFSYVRTVGGTGRWTSRISHVGPPPDQCGLQEGQQEIQS